MTATERKPRTRKTDADRLESLHAKMRRANEKAALATKAYADALREAHKRAEAAKSALPPMEESR